MGTPSETRLWAIERRLVAVEEDQDDLRRQHSKSFIVFCGPALQMLPDGSWFSQLRWMVREYWSLPLEKSEVGATHPIENVKGFIALFLDRNQGSTFHQILTNLPNWQFRAPLSAKQLLQSRSDLRFDFIARQMHAAGEIRGHRVHWMSGKLEVTLRNGQSQTFSDPASLLHMASQVTCNLVRNK
jgi:hypothetical protein